MNGFDAGVGEDGVVIAGGALDANGVREIAGELVGQGGDGGDLDVAEAAHLLGMNFPHKTGTDYGCFDFAHGKLDSTVMLVRIRLRSGPRVAPRKRRKNRHIALASAALLTPAAVMAFVLGVWRLGADLGFTRAFAIQGGLLSHWQVWLAISVAIQFLAVVLNRYGGSAQAEMHDLEIAAEHGSGVVEHTSA